MIDCEWYASEMTAEMNGFSKLTNFSQFGYQNFSIMLLLTKMKQVNWIFLHMTVRNCPILLVSLMPFSLNYVVNVLPLLCHIYTNTNTHTFRILCNVLNLVGILSYNILCIIWSNYCQTLGIYIFVYSFCQSAWKDTV